MQRFDVIVIGQGYAGVTVARLAAARGLRTANFEAMYAGGLVMNVNELDPVPEGGEHVGAELVSNIAMANMDNGVVSVAAPAIAISRGADGAWTVEGDAELHVAPSIVVATGARLRKLGVPGEEEFFGRGISECADCDGPMFQDMETVVVGGGDSAFQEALALCQYAGKVTIIMRGEKPRARAGLVERAAGNPKIALLPKTQVLAVEGNGSGVTGVRVRAADGAERTIACSGVFVFIGLDPNAVFLPGELARDGAGAIIASDDGATNLPGLYAIGAVRSGFGGLLSDALADAERVAARLA
jgi:thioredoxin reductase (NADPH)